jgi:mutual gliding-motility protein MglA
MPVRTPIELETPIPLANGEPDVQSERFGLREQHRENAERNANLIYYGVGFGGKGSNLRALERLAGVEPVTLVRPEPREANHLMFDYLALDLPHGRRVHAYTICGVVESPFAWLSVLKRADAVVFVVDSQIERVEANIEALERLRSAFEALEREIPFVFQYNKRDLENAAPVEELNLRLEPQRQATPARASTGEGVWETLQSALRLCGDDFTVVGAPTLTPGTYASLERLQSDAPAGKPWWKLW